MLITAVLSLTHSNNRIDLILKPAIKSIDENGNELYIDPPETIKFLIEGELKYEILDMIDKLPNNKLSKSLDVDIDIPESQNLVYISYSTKNADTGIEKIKFLIKALETRYADKINIISDEYDKDKHIKKTELVNLKVQQDRILKRCEKKLTSKKAKLKDFKVQEDRIVKKYERELLLKKNKLINLKSKENMISNDIESINERIEDMVAKNVIIRNNTKKLIDERKGLIKTDTQNDPIGNLLLSNVTQQNINLANSFQNRLTNYNLARNQKEYSLYDVRSQINEVDQEIAELEKTMSNKQLISILQPDLYNIRSHIDDIKKEASELETALSNKQLLSILQPDIYNIWIKIDDVERELEEIEKKKKNIKTINIVKPPVATKTSKTKSNLILSAVVGAFLMIFLSFFFEYLSNHKKNRI